MNSDNNNVSKFLNFNNLSITAVLLSADGVEGKWQDIGGSWAKGDFGTLAFGTISSEAGARL